MTIPPKSPTDELRRVPKDIWPRKELSVTARYLLVYLYTCPHWHFLGRGCARIAYAQSDTGLAEQELESAINELVNAGDVVRGDRSLSLTLTDAQWEELYADEGLQ